MGPIVVLLSPRSAFNAAPASLSAFAASTAMTLDWGVCAKAAVEKAAIRRYLMVSVPFGKS